MGCQRKVKHDAGHNVQSWTVLLLIALEYGIEICIPEICVFH